MSSQNHASTIKRYSRRGLMVRIATGLGAIATLGLLTRGFISTDDVDPRASGLPKDSIFQPRR